jgi:hypothetical protein
MLYFHRWFHPEMWRERVRAVGGVRLATFVLGFIVLYQLLSVEHHGSPVGTNDPTEAVTSAGSDTRNESDVGSGGSAPLPARPAVKTSSIVYICAWFFLSISLLCGCGCWCACRGALGGLWRCVVLHPWATGAGWKDPVDSQVLLPTPRCYPDTRLALRSTAFSGFGGGGSGEGVMGSLWLGRVVGGARGGGGRRRRRLVAGPAALNLGRSFPVTR